MQHWKNKTFTFWLVSDTRTLNSLYLTFESILLFHLLLFQAIATSSFVTFFSYAISPFASRISSSNSLIYFSLIFVITHIIGLFSWHCSAAACNFNVCIFTTVAFSCRTNNNGCFMSQFIM